MAPTFLHRLRCEMDSGVNLNLLMNLAYISLDTFRTESQNIDSNLKAWLTFLSSDKPEDIMRLVDRYPEFKDCYHDIIMFRKKPEELMNMFSEALIQMDKNTVQYMIEEQQKELEASRKELEAIYKEQEASRKELEASRKEQEASRKELNEKEEIIRELQAKLEALQKEQ